MLNKIIVQGRMTRDPELRYTQSQKPVASFSLACDRDYVPTGEDRQADFIDVVAFGKTAEFVDQYFLKGSMAIVTGRLQLRDWTDKDGNKRRSAEILAEHVYFGERKRDGGETARPASAPVDVSAATFEELAEDGELPY